MTNALIVFPDAPLAVRDLLREQLACRTEAFAQNVTVSTREIPGSDADGWNLPYVQVISDGRFRSANLNGRATVRCLVYHEDEGLADQLASLIEGILLSSGSDRVRNCGAMMGPRTTRDPDNGLPLSTLTVNARLRPQQL